MFAASRIYVKGVSKLSDIELNRRIIVDELSSSNFSVDKQDRQGILTITQPDRILRLAHSAE